MFKAFIEPNIYRALKFREYSWEMNSDGMKILNKRGANCLLLLQCTADCSSYTGDHKQLLCLCISNNWWQTFVLFNACKISAYCFSKKFVYLHFFFNVCVVCLSDKISSNHLTTGMSAVFTLWNQISLKTVAFGRLFRLYKTFVLCW